MTALGMAGDVAGWLLAVGSATALTGCLPIPHTHTKLPAASFLLRDARGSAIVGGRVLMYGGVIVGKHVDFTDSVATTERGVATFARRREWHPFYVLVPDGEAPWVWGWCAEAPTMDAVYGLLDQPPRDTIRVTLRAAAARSASHCPARPASLYSLPRAVGT